MLIYSMTVSLDGYIADRDGTIDWSEPSDELFAFHLARVRTLGAHLCGRRLYQTMLPWEHDPALRQSDLHAEFAAVWCALPKVVFSRTLDGVEGNARLARQSLADELARVQQTSGRDIEIGGAALAGAAIELGLVDEFRIFRAPVVLGGGTPHLPATAGNIPLRLMETRPFSSGVIYERYQRPEPSTASPAVS